MPQSHFKKGVYLTFLREVLSFLIGISKSIILARFLGTSGRGKFAEILLLPQIINIIGNLGNESATVYFIGQSQYPNKEIFKTNLIANLVYSFFGISIGLLVVEFFHVFPDVPKFLLIIILFIIPFQFIQKSIFALFQGIQNFTFYNFSILFYQILQLSFLLFFVISCEDKLYGAVLAEICSNVVNFLILIVFTIKLVGWKAPFSKRYFIESVKYGIKAFLSNVATFLNYRIDILILAIFVSPGNLGLYAVAVTIAESLWKVSSVFSTVLFPRIAHMKGSPDKRLITAKVTRNVFFINGLISIILILIGNFAISFLYGSEFHNSYYLLIILLPGVTLYSASKVISNYFGGIGKPVINLYFSIFILIFNVILNFILIPPYGIYGAAAATSAVYCIGLITNSTIFLIRSSMSFTDLLLIKQSDIVYYKHILKNFRKGKL